jgi:glycosyltransferase A (GT-A) superfamily protein (DUF2064 family)
MRVFGMLAKEPVAGAVKTRLAAQTSPDFAARVAEAFLRDQLERLAGLPCRRVLAHAPDTAAPRFTDLAQGHFELTPQGEGDLGQRMGRFVTQRLGEGAEATVLVGADSPTLPLDFIQTASTC